MTEPLSDTILFLIGNIGDYVSLDPAKYISVTFYLFLLATGFYVAGRNWADDPSQRAVRSVCVFVIRVVAGGMWFQGTIWSKCSPPLGRTRFGVNGGAWRILVDAGLGM